MHRRTTGSIALLIAIAALLAGACGGSEDSDDNANATTTEAPTTVRLGYFPNVTHATAIVGVERGIFEKALGSDKLEITTFNAGPAAVEALFSDALDAAYIGPNPAINAHVTSKGEAIRIIAGSTSGGAALVAKPGITKATDLEGKKVATPQLGNTQDVALRFWLDEAGLKTDPEGGGDVSILPQENSQTLETFKSGAIQAAWVPEPWVSRLVQEGGGTVIVNEKDLWPDGAFVTTHLIVRTEFLKDHPGAVRRLLHGHLEASAFVNDNEADAKTTVNAGIEKITGKGLKAETIDAAWRNLTFTVDPIASSLRGSADHAEAVGLLEKVDLGSIYDLDLLNALLADDGEDEVKGL